MQRLRSLRLTLAYLNGLLLHLAHQQMRFPHTPAILKSNQRHCHASSRVEVHHSNGLRWYSVPERVSLTQRLQDLVGGSGQAVHMAMAVGESSRHVCRKIRSRQANRYPRQRSRDLLYSSRALREPQMHPIHGCCSRRAQSDLTPTQVAIVDSRGRPVSAPL